MVTGSRTALEKQVAGKESPATADLLDAQDKVRLRIAEFHAVPVQDELGVLGQQGPDPVFDPA